jgi:hypothetical protein
MIGAGGLSAAYNKRIDHQEAEKQRGEKAESIRLLQKKKEDELDDISNFEDQVSITNERKNILDKISK